LRLSGATQRRFQAIALCQSLVEFARTIPPSKLPPQSFRVDSPQNVQLPVPVAGSKVDSQSIVVYRLDGAPLGSEQIYDEATGQVQLSNVAKSDMVCVEYAFEVPFEAVAIGAASEFEEADFKLHLLGKRFQTDSESAASRRPLMKRMTATVSWNEGGHRGSVSVGFLRAGYFVNEGTKDGAGAR
jgi:hypothetical protein